MPILNIVHDILGNTLKKDVTKYCKDVLALMDHARSTQQRVTGLKVVDAWMGKGATSLRVSTWINAFPCINFEDLLGLSPHI